MKKPIDPIIYTTGRTPAGISLIGGVWKLYEQVGYPLELSHLECQGKRQRIDWMEAMADASRSNNLPALMQAVATFLPSDTIYGMKRGFAHVLASGKTFEQIVAEKRAGSPLRQPPG